jgi:hypothetical protein
MSSDRPEISRRQAWFRLAVLIADGLPEPREISFHVDSSSIYVQFDTAAALKAWARKLRMRVDTPFKAPHGDWIHSASTASAARWFGYYVSLSAYTKGDAEIEPPQDDLSAVRRLARVRSTKDGDTDE